MNIIVTHVAFASWAIVVPAATFLLLHMASHSLFYHEANGMEILEKGEREREGESHRGSESTFYFVTTIHYECAYVCTKLRSPACYNIKLHYQLVLFFSADVCLPD